jgi:hypothetical protein
MSVRGPNEFPQLLDGACVPNMAGRQWASG